MSHGWWPGQPDYINIEWIYSGGSREVRFGAIAPLKPAKVVSFTMVLYKPENSIREVRSFGLPLFCQSSIVKNTLSLLQ